MARIQAWVTIASATLGTPSDYQTLCGHISGNPQVLLCMLHGDNSGVLLAQATQNEVRQARSIQGCLNVKSVGISLVLSVPSVSGKEAINTQAS